MALRRWLRRSDEPPVDLTGPATVYPHRSGGYPPPPEPSPTSTGSRVPRRELDGDSAPPILADWPGPGIADIDSQARADAFRHNTARTIRKPPCTEGPPQ
jgi:hypothetical protein